MRAAWGAAAMKALIHVQHLLGTGHFVRMAAIGRALAARGVDLTLVTGNTPPATARTDGLSIVELPPVRSLDASFQRLVGPDGVRYKEGLHLVRRDILLDLAADVKPDIVLLETYPFGRKPFVPEIVPMIERARAVTPHVLVASSIRDILARKEDIEVERMMAGWARDQMDIVLVHADPAAVRIEESFAFASEIDHLFRYTGFVHEFEVPDDTPERDGDGTGEVLVSTGGGGVGLELFEAAIGTRALSPKLAGLRFRLLVSGSHAPEARAGLARMAADAAPDGGIIVDRTRPDFAHLLRRSALSISQAGYNTALDILAAGRPAVLVPFVDGGETEQRQRSELFAAREIAVLCEPDGMTPESLARAAEAALALPRTQPAFAMDGAERSAEILIAEARSRIAPSAAAHG